MICHVKKVLTKSSFRICVANKNQIAKIGKSFEDILKIRKSFGRIRKSDEENKKISSRKSYSEIRKSVQGN